MNNNTKKDYIWNTAAGLINAAEAIIMSMVVTRVTNLTDAGILTIAFALGNQLINIGKFGMRNFQVTDARKQYSFSIYLKCRLITVAAMILATICYLIYAASLMGYSSDKIYAILLICLIYAVEALEDVFWGYYQLRDHLATGAQLFCARWITILLVFAITLIFRKDLVTSLLAAFLVSVIVFAFMVLHTFSGISTDLSLLNALKPAAGDAVRIRSLLFCCFPLFGNAFLSFYVNNTPKYAIDACMSDEVQACYGFVAMPVFVIGLLNNFIYQPTLVNMALEWRERKLVQLVKRIQRQILIIIGLTVICLIGAYLLGIPVLSLLYSTDLTDYKTVLMILLLASGFLALAGYLGVILVIMRCQKEMLITYCVVALTALLFMTRVVRIYGTVGAAIAYTMLMILVCLIYGVVLIKKFRKEKVASTSTAID